jgi:hypothetical protein
MQLWGVELEEAPVAMGLSPKGQLLAVGTVDDVITSEPGPHTPLKDCMRARCAQPSRD